MIANFLPNTIKIDLTKKRAAKRQPEVFPEKVIHHIFIEDERSVPFLVFIV